MRVTNSMPLERPLSNRCHRKLRHNTEGTSNQNEPLSRSQQQHPPMIGPSERCLPIVATRHPARSALCTIVFTHNKVMPSKLCDFKGCSSFNKKVRNVETLEKCIFKHSYPKCAWKHGPCALSLCLSVPRLSVAYHFLCRSVK
jgi:hypothetical protein